MAAQGRGARSLPRGRGSRRAACSAGDCRRARIALRLRIGDRWCRSSWRHALRRQHDRRSDLACRSGRNAVARVVSMVSGACPVAVMKCGLAHGLRSEALRNDAASSLTCGYMAGAVLVGVACTTLFDWWWAEGLAAFVFFFWLVQETREAIEEVR